MNAPDGRLVLGATSSHRAEPRRRTKRAHLLPKLDDCQTRLFRARARYREPLFPLQVHDLMASQLQPCCYIIPLSLAPPDCRLAACSCLTAKKKKTLDRRLHNKQLEVRAWTGSEAGRGCRDIPTAPSPLWARLVSDSWSCGEARMAIPALLSHRSPWISNGHLLSQLQRQRPVSRCLDTSTKFGMHQLTCKTLQLMLPPHISRYANSSPLSGSLI